MSEISFYLVPEGSEEEEKSVHDSSSSSSSGTDDDDDDSCLGVSEELPEEEEEGEGGGEKRLSQRWPNKSIKAIITEMALYGAYTNAFIKHIGFRRGLGEVSLLLKEHVWTQYVIHFMAILRPDLETRLPVPEKVRVKRQNRRSKALAKKAIARDERKRKKEERRKEMEKKKQKHNRSGSNDDDEETSEEEEDNSDSSSSSSGGSSEDENEEEDYEDPEFSRLDPIGSFFIEKAVRMLVATFYDRKNDRSKWGFDLDDEGSVFSLFGESHRGPVSFNVPPNLAVMNTEEKDFGFWLPHMQILSQMVDTVLPFQPDPTLRFVARVHPKDIGAHTVSKMVRALIPQDKRIFYGEEQPVGVKDYPLDGTKWDSDSILARCDRFTDAFMEATSLEKMFVDIRNEKMFPLPPQAHVGAAANRMAIFQMQIEAEDRRLNLSRFVRRGGGDSSSSSSAAATLDEEGGGLAAAIAAEAGTHLHLFPSAAPPPKGHVIEFIKEVRKEDHLLKKIFSDHVEKARLISKHKGTSLFFKKNTAPEGVASDADIIRFIVDVLDLGKHNKLFTHLRKLSGPGHADDEGILLLVKAYQKVLCNVVRSRILLVSTMCYILNMISMNFSTLSHDLGYFLSGNHHYGDESAAGAEEEEGGGSGGGSSSSSSLSSVASSLMKKNPFSKFINTLSLSATAVAASLVSQIRPVDHREDMMRIIHGSMNQTVRSTEEIYANLGDNFEKAVAVLVNDWTPEWEPVRQGRFEAEKSTYDALSPRNLRCVVKAKNHQKADEHYLFAHTEKYFEEVIAIGEKLYNMNNKDLLQQIKSGEFLKCTNVNDIVTALKNESWLQVIDIFLSATSSSVFWYGVIPDLPEEINLTKKQPMWAF